MSRPRVALSLSGETQNSDIYVRLGKICIETKGLIAVRRMRLVAAKPLPEF